MLYYKYKKSLFKKNNDLKSSFDGEYKNVLKLWIHFRKRVENPKLNKIIIKNIKPYIKKYKKNYKTWWNWDWRT